MKFFWELIFLAIVLASGAEAGTRKIRQRCGYTRYSPSTHTCCKDTVNIRRPNFFCCGRAAYPKRYYACCDGSVYNKFSFICCGGVIRYKGFNRTVACCGTLNFNYRTQKCCSGRIVPKWSSCVRWK